MRYFYLCCIHTYSLSGRGFVVTKYDYGPAYFTVNKIPAYIKLRIKRRL